MLVALLFWIMIFTLSLKIISKGWVLFESQRYCRSMEYIGDCGEREVMEELESLPKSHYRVLHDVRFQLGSGRNVQIDHLVVSRYGIFVVETKNFGGRIYGRHKSRYWTSYYGYGCKVTAKRFYNPFFQNYGHIRSIEDYFGKVLRFPKVISIVTFSDRAEIKVNDCRTLCYYDQLVGLIVSHDQEVMTGEEMEWVFSVISPFSRSGSENARERFLSQQCQFNC